MLFIIIFQFWSHLTWSGDPAGKFKADVWAAPPPPFLPPTTGLRLGSLSPSEQIRHTLSPSPSSSSSASPSLRKETRPTHRSRSIARQSDLHREAVPSSSSSSSNSQYDVINGGVDAMKSTFSHLKSLAREMNNGVIDRSSASGGGGGGGAAAAAASLSSSSAASKEAAAASASSLSASSSFKRPSTASLKAPSPKSAPPERKLSGGSTGSGAALEKAQAAVEKATKNAARKTEKFLRK